MEHVDIIPSMILACCILHNICLLRGDEFKNIEPNVLEPEPEVAHGNNATRAELATANQRGLVKEITFVNNYKCEMHDIGCICMYMYVKNINGYK